jgi:GT2 family glycosyltransferase
VLEDGPLARVVIAISSYRSDAQVLQLLAKIFQEEISVAAVIVVDSLSKGALEQEIVAAGWPVQFENAGTNLGSAGNLARRLELAAACDADWCFAINHDGMISRTLIETLVKAASGRCKVGAVYPKRVWLDRAGTILKPHAHVFKMPIHAASHDAVFGDEVAWDSSNGALYGLEPIRKGVRVWSDLWYGWEDLAYGWQLTQAGWKQYFCADAVYMDDYEYQHIRVFGRDIYITRKPSWTTYYVIRNLLLIVKRTGGGLRAWTFFIKRVFREVMLAILFRDRKRERLSLALKGIADGFIGKAGKGLLP